MNYKVSVSSQISSMTIFVEPKSLTFSEPNEKKKKNLHYEFITSSMPSGMTNFAHFEWLDGKHIFGSPVAFSWT